MPKFHYALLVFFICSCMSAQSSISLKGKVIDENTKLPIESATVYVSNVKDSTVVDYTITDKFGKFDFKIKKSDKPVYLKVSFVAYQDFKIDLKNSESLKDFGTISLKEAIKSLDEVVVKSEAPPIRIKKDTLEFNVSSFKVRPDANVETLLKQLPGVEIDSDGKITVNGKEVILIGHGNYWINHLSFGGTKNHITGVSSVISPSSKGQIIRFYSSKFKYKMV